ncbi:4Fe-4S binding protein [Clostridium thermarum]|uniref:4Fe-4S binding protein n=2 Tax=Clostridium thermarum TaxID=1716543 RepID=UPI001FAAF6F2|nr:4Fe-4S binding protein [Clostridium thermarum]
MNIMIFLWKKCSFIFLIALFVFGFFNSKLSLIGALCMILPLVISIFRGRYWCGNLCPRGSLYDNLLFAFSNHKQVPRVLKSEIIRYTIVVIMLSTFFKGILSSKGDLFKIGMVFYKIIGITTLIGILLTLLYNERAWCNICPMGTLSNLISQLNDNRKLLNVGTNCISCRICSKKCPMGVAPYTHKGKGIDNPDCIQCGRCRKACPQKCITYKK